MEDKTDVSSLHICKFTGAFFSAHTHTHTNTRPSLYFNLGCGPPISVHHKPLLPLSCLHSNAIATRYLQSPWHEPNPPLSNLSICHQWLRGLSIKPSWHLDWQLPLRHSRRVRLLGMRRAREGRAQECENWFIIWAPVFPDRQRGNSQKVGKDKCRGVLKGVRSDLHFCLWLPGDVGCPNCLTHPIHHRRATCITPSWRTPSLQL